MIACCECHKIPAYLFCRLPKRRWDAHGEIKLHNNIPLPRWGAGLTHLNLDTPSADFIQASALGLHAENGPRGPWHHFSPHLKPLLRRGILVPLLEEGCLYLVLEGSSKAFVRRSCSIENRIELLWDLVELVVLSAPDIYAETLWQSFRLQSKGVIESTLLPFLSVTESEGQGLDRPRLPM